MQALPYTNEIRQAKARRAQHLRELITRTVAAIEPAPTPPAVRVYVTLELSHQDVRELCQHLSRKVLTRLALRAWGRHVLRHALDSLRGAL